MARRSWARAVVLVIILLIVASLTGQVSPAARGKVVVSKSGWFPTETSTTGDIGWALELTNTSKALDAVDVEVTVTFIDRRGVSLDEDTEYVSVVPAGKRFYVSSGGVRAYCCDTVARLRVTVAVDRFVSHRYSLPNVTNVRLSRNPTHGFVGVESIVRNSLPKTLLVSGYSVLFDKSGRIVGDTNADGVGKLPPGRAAKLRGASYSERAYSRAASARVSVDNYGANYEPIPGK